MSRSSVLELRGIVNIPAVVAGEVKARLLDETRFWFSEEFIAEFLSGKIKGIADNIGIRLGICCYQLLESARDNDILRWIGGVDRAEVTLDVMIGLIDMVIISGDARYVLYIKNSAGVLRAVTVHQYRGRWELRFFQIDDMSGWNTDSRFLSY